MRRLIVPIALVLALVTGVVVAETRLALTPMPIVERDGDRDENVDLVRRWYGAVNQVLRSGNVSGLDDLLALDFVSNVGRPAGTANKSTLKTYLLELHATYPEARLTVLDLTTEDDRVVARVRIDGASRGRFLGVPIAGTRIWGAFDVFRISSGRIAEHWGDGEPLPRFESLLVVPLPARPTEGGLVAMVRRTYPVGQSEFTTNPNEFAVVLVEAGALRFAPDRTLPGHAWRIAHATAAEAAAARRVEPGTIAMLGAGDALIFEDDSAGTFGNDGVQDASVLVVAVADTSSLSTRDGLSGGGSHAATPEAGAPPAFATELLAGDNVVASLGRETVIAIGRLSLPTGGVPSHAVVGVELLSVEAGSQALAAGRQRAWVHRARDGRVSSLVPAAWLEIGDGALIPDGAEARYWSTSDAPLELLIVTIAPEQTGANAN